MNNAPGKFRLLTLVALSAAVAAPVVAMNLDHVAQVRQAVADHDPAYDPALHALLDEANQALTAGPWTVTVKKMLPPSHDRKDYVSFGPYWWPDPKKPDGLPYIQRDGQINPDSRTNSDRTRLQNTIETVTTLSLASYLTGKRQYAEHAALCLRTFFLDPKTGMNPNLNFAQGIPGIVKGRGTGIIDFNSIPEMLDAVKLLEQSAPKDVWTDADRAGFHDWCTKFLDWLDTSDNGKHEAEAANNHGDWFDATSSSFAYFVGRDDLVRKIVARTRGRIADQIQPDGTLPREMARTRSWHYTLFALQAFTITCERARRVGIDLWDYRPPAAHSGTLTDAITHVLHYSQTKDPWPKKDIDSREDPAGIYLQVRSVLDPAKDAALCRQLDAAIAAAGPSVDAMRQQLTFALVRGK